MTETATYQDPNDILMGGGDGVPSAKFPDPGTFVDGIITGYKAYQEREFNKQTGRSDGDVRKFPSGDVIMGIAVDLQTTERDVTIEGDTGARRLYVQGKNLKATVREAIQAAGGRGLEVGARLRVDFTHRDDPMDKGSAKNYTAVYQTAANVQVMGGPVAVQPVVAPAPAPTVAAPVAAAPVAQPVAVPAPVPAAAAPAQDPVALARTLIASQVPDAAISAATGLDVVVIQALRNQAA